MFNRAIDSYFTDGITRLNEICVTDVGITVTDRQTLGRGDTMSCKYLILVVPGAPFT